MRNFLYLAIISFSLIYSNNETPSDYPGKNWEQYKNVSDAGFDSAKLELVKQKFKDFGGDAFLVIRNGKIVLSIGKTTRCFRQTSIRKSYLNALYGIYSSKGIINLNSTLKELEIDDIHHLTEKEKEATVFDLLRSRSGVYHPAAYSPASMEKNLPKRGSYSHGEHWFYNNWDFNTLGGIFTQLTNKDIFKEFEKQIALPLEFEDFSLAKTKYIYESKKSRYPAYSFRSSARDMARFGLLYLNNGKWKSKRTIDQEWIKNSFKRHSVNGVDSNGISWDSYGLLWWVSNNIKEERVVYAAGSGAQRISLFPESNMVMVHLVDNYQPKMVSDEKVDELTRLLLKAKSGEPKKNAALITYQPSRKRINKVNLSEISLKQFVGNYRNPQFGTFKVIRVKHQLKLETGIGNFVLQAVEDNKFIDEDTLIPVVFEKGDTDEKYTFRPVFQGKNKIGKFVFFY